MLRISIYKIRENSLVEHCYPGVQSIEIKNNKLLLHWSKEDVNLGISDKEVKEIDLKTHTIINNIKLIKMN